jgi:uncharacterized membrane protein
MPFCNQCGKPVTPADVYCAGCGGAQPQATPPAPPKDYLSGISPRTASLLCYIPILGWLAAIVVLASARFRANRRVRFDAFQGLYLFVAWLIVDWVIDFPGMNGTHLFTVLLKAVIFGAWIFMIVKVSQDQEFKLPILGDLAEKSVSEQR